MNQEEKTTKANTTAPAVNEKAADPATPADVKNIGQAPATAGNANPSPAHNVGAKFENAVNAQNQQNMQAQATTGQGAKPVRKVDTIADLIAISKILKP